MASVLIVSPEPWEAHTVSKHHYAAALARLGHGVIFFGPPEKNSVHLTLESVECDGFVLRVVRSGRVARGLAYSPAWLRQFLERRWLQKLERAAHLRVDLVWLFENSRFFDMRFAGQRAKIYHQVDLNQDFHPIVAARTADLVIANSGPIERLIKSSARSMLRLGHGVAQGVELPIEDTLLNERFSPPCRHVALTGNLDSGYFDVNLLIRLVEDHRDTRFHLVGSYDPVGRLFCALGAAPNVTWWGRQPAASLPSILRRADLLLVIYNAELHRDQLANPHKIMEYLASGRPILATYTEEYAQRSDLVLMAANAADFRDRFATLIDDLGTLQDQVASSYRMRYAGECTYDNRIRQIVEALDDAFVGPNPLRARGL